MEREHQLTNLSARFVDLGVKPLKTKEHKMRMAGPEDPEEAHEVIMIAGRLSGMSGGPATIDLGLIAKQTRKSPCPTKS
jgi:hypothetical protein